MADAKKKGEKTSVMISPRGQFAFLYAEEPHVEGQYADKKYKTTFLVDEAQKEELVPIKKAMLEAARKHWGQETKYSSLETPFYSGTDKANEVDAAAKKDGKEPGKMDNFREKIYFRTSSTRKPGIVGPDKKPLPEGEDVQSGDFGRISIVAHTYERTAQVIRDGKRVNEVVKGVGFWLQNIMKLKTGNRMGGSKPEQDFGDVPVDELDLEEGKKASAEESFDETPAKGGSAPATSSDSEDDVF